jgi:hypothetical protein
MQLNSPSKYDLQDLYQEIDFYDRKIAHCRDHEQFACEADRTAQLNKLATKRQTLLKQATELGSHGIVSDPKYLPRSLRTAAEAAPPAKAAV